MQSIDENTQVDVLQNCVKSFKESLTQIIVVYPAVRITIDTLHGNPDRPILGLSEKKLTDVLLDNLAKIFYWTAGRYQIHGYHQSTQSKKKKSSFSRLFLIL